MSGWLACGCFFSIHSLSWRELGKDYSVHFLAPWHLLFQHPPKGKSLSVLCAHGLRKEGEEFGESKFWISGPIRPTFTFHSFSTIIGIGVGAGAYVLSRYAVRNLKNPR